MMFRLCLQLLLLRLQLFFQKSLKEEQRECIRGIVYRKEVLPTGFCNSVIYSPEYDRWQNQDRTGVTAFCVPPNSGH